MAVAVLIVGAGAAQSLVAQVAADGARGSIAGKLTDLYSMPVEGAVVVVRNEATGAEARSTTLKNGIYSFTGLDSRRLYGGGGEQATGPGTSGAHIRYRRPRNTRADGDGV